MLAALDCETTGLDLFGKDLPFMVCVTFEDKKQITWEWDVDPFTRIPKIELEDLDEIVTFLKDPSITWVLHNAKFDVRCIEKAIQHLAKLMPKLLKEKQRTMLSNILSWSPLKFLSLCHDTQLECHALDNIGSHGLKDIGVRYLNIGEDDLDDLREQIESIIPLVKSFGWKYASPSNISSARKAPAKGWWVMDMWLPKAYRNYTLSLIADQKSTAGITPQRFRNDDKYSAFDNKCRKYCLRDTERTLLCHVFFEAELKKEGLWEQYLQNRELLEVTYAMESYGVSVNVPLLSNEIVRLRNIAKGFEYKTRMLIHNRSFNLNSPTQIARTLAIKFGIQPSRFTANNQATCDKRELEELYQKHKETAPDSALVTFLNNVMSFKKCVTASNYLDGYLSALVGDKLHPSFNICGSDESGMSTTRMSSSNPNGQNISKGKSAFNEEIKALGLNLRKVFGPLPGRQWWSIDYKQLQLVIFATISGETSMINSVKKGEDFHDFVHRKIADALGWKYDPTDSQTHDAQRTIAKNVNFGFIFGAGPAKIEETARTPGLYEVVKSLFPTAHDFITQNMKKARRNGYIEACGYRLYVPRDRLYAATNYMVQGWEGKIVKLAMLYCHRYLSSVPETDIHLILNVHDELIFDAPADANQKHLITICGLMEKAAIDCKVPCKVDPEVITTNWSEGKPFRPSPPQVLHKVSHEVSV